MVPDPAAAWAAWENWAPNGRWADPSEQAKAVLYRMRDADVRGRQRVRPGRRIHDPLSPRPPGVRAKGKGDAVQFGAVLGGDPLTTARETRLLEERGFSAVWFPHVPTVGWGDPYICMAQAAAASTRIRVGTSVVPARLRTIPDLLTAIATVNRIAPGRVNLVV